MIISTYTELVKYEGEPKFPCIAVPIDPFIDNENNYRWEQLCITDSVLRCPAHYFILYKCSKYKLMTNKTYILLKDLPGLPAGGKIYWSDLNQGYTDIKIDYRFTQNQIDNSPEFFKLEEPMVYTESDLKKAAKDAFVAAREEVVDLHIGKIEGELSNKREYKHKYKTFQDYIKHKS